MMAYVPCLSSVSDAVIFSSLSQKKEEWKWKDKAYLAEFSIGGEVHQIKQY